jgi:hypothetical protein
MVAAASVCRPGGLAGRRRIPAAFDSKTIESLESSQRDEVRVCL